MRILAIGAILVVFAGTSCSSDERLGVEGSAASAGTAGPSDREPTLNLGAGGSAGTSPDGDAASAGRSDSLRADTPLAEFCAGRGPLITLPGTDTPTCTGDIAAKRLRFAVCSCQDFAWEGQLRTDSFNSQTRTQGQNGSVGVNGAVTGPSPFDIGGSLWVGGNTRARDAVQLVGAGRVSGEVHSGGTIASSGQVSIEGDVYSEGALSIQGSFDVAGSVIVPAGTRVEGAAAAQGTVHQPVDVATPCDCETPLDIQGIVAAFSQKNDNAAAGVDSHSFEQFPSGKSVELDCGRYYFTRIVGTSLSLHVNGRTAIFIDGELNMLGALEIDLKPGAELDLFVAGNVTFTGATSFGSVAEPARIRVYVGGSNVALDGQMKLGANLYAPFARVAAVSHLEMSGSVFGKQLEFPGGLTVHYDEAVLDVPGCDPPGHDCGSCEDCYGSAGACKENQCTACSSNGDCCPPQRCNSGVCGVMVK